MRVEDKTNINSFENVKDTQKKAEVKKQTAGLAGSSPDRISISDNAKDVSMITKAVKSSPEIREDKVSALKKQIDSGTYDVTGEMVAEKIVSNAINGTF